MRFPLLGVVALLSGIVLSNPAGALTTASVADLSLPVSPYGHTSRASSGTLLLTVSSDDLAGWNVSVGVSEFSYTGEFAGAPIPASSLSITTANEPSFVTGQVIDQAGGPRVPATGASGSLDVSRKVLQADASFGQGSYSQELQVSMTIPGRTKTGTYTGTLTVTTGSGP